MDSVNLASGDNINALPRSSRFTGPEDEIGHVSTDDVDKREVYCKDEVTTKAIDDNEARLKERISQCRNIIESLKSELNDEKAKLEKEKLCAPQVDLPRYTTAFQDTATADAMRAELSYDTSVFSSCVDNKLPIDDNLMEYEKQLQKYQNTLNMAQVEKKNAIRRQMLAKAYKLKLMEVENQCNIELLRVKQSLQCLEPLKMIASQWKTNISEEYDYSTFDLSLPKYPELRANSGSDVLSASKEDFDTKMQVEQSECAENVFSPSD